MTGLPFIDEHPRQIDASPEQVWTALLETVRQIGPQLPGWLISAWGLQPAESTGDWDGTVQVGDTRPGFAVTEVRPPQVLLLRGCHRFAEYELRWELERARPGAVCLRARTSAAFPGLKGRVYRAAVIGTGGHRVAVRRILARVGSRAESTNSLRSEAQITTSPRGT